MRILLGLVYLIEKLMYYQWSNFSQLCKILYFKSSWHLWIIVDWCIGGNCQCYSSIFVLVSSLLDIVFYKIDCIFLISYQCYVHLSQLIGHWTRQ